MANKKSALTRIRSNETKRLRNRYQLKTCRTFVKKLKNTTDQQEAGALFKRVSSMLDKLARKNVIHKNKAAHSKSALSRGIEGLK
jgi:small subunit ribosomal protein S20